MHKVFIKCFILSLFFFNIKSAFAQPTGCKTPVSPYNKEGGDFDIINPDGILVADNLCIPSGLDSIRIQFVEKIDPLIGTFLSNVGYAFNINNSTNIATSVKSANSITPQVIANEGEYWFAQVGIANSQGYLKCKKIQVHKIQPVEATIKNCGASTITITIPSKSQNPQNNHTRYKIDWNDGSPVIYENAKATEIIITRTFSPINRIIVTGEYLDNSGNVVCASNSKFLNIPVTNEVYIDKLVTQDNLTDFEVTFKGFVTNTNYKVSYALDDGNYNWKIDPNNHVNGSASIKGLDAKNNYCFKISYVDVCGVSSESNTVCSIKLNGDLVSDEEMLLEWNLPKSPSGVLQRNEIEENALNCTNCFNTLLPANFTDTKYLNKNLDCGKTYTYTAITNNVISISGKNRAIEVISNTLKIDPANSSPPQPINPMAVSYINDKEIFATIFQSSNPQASYKFYRAENGSSNFKLVDSTKNNSFTDTDIDPSVDFYCYKYTYTDDCGRVSALSDAYCSIFLTSKSTNTLNWTKYFAPNTTETNPTVYDIEVFDPISNNFKRVDNSIELSKDIASQLALFAGQPSVTFRIVSYLDIELTKNGEPFIFNVLSNPYTFVFSSEFFIPSAFTPNGDGINEEFKPELRFADEGSLIIYDRWGSVIFETTDLSTGWNGSINNDTKPMPSGAYIYKIQVLDENKVPLVKTGTVTLLR